MTTDVSLTDDTPGHLRPRGSSQGGLRQYNERVVLQALRLHGALPAAELARLTHLTAQTISMITKRLLDEGLLLKGQPLRGKVGQPSVPLSLNPDGAMSVGIKVGRRSLDILLVDFNGQARQRNAQWPMGARKPRPGARLHRLVRRRAAAGRTDPARRAAQGQHRADRCRQRQHRQPQHRLGGRPPLGRGRPLRRTP